MSGKESEKLQKTKEELQREIRKVEDLFDDSIGKAKQEISAADPRKQIRKNPLPAVGIAILGGFLLSKIAFKKKKDVSEISLDKSKIGPTVWEEVKQRMIRIGVRKAGDYVEDFLDDTIAKKMTD